MSPIALTLLKFALLGLLYLFVWFAVRTVAHDVAGKRQPRKVVPAAVATAAPPPAEVRDGAAPGTLVIREPDVPERRVGLRDAVEIGRGPGVAIVLTDGFASHRHARIEPRGTERVLVDLGSTNGTFLNEEPVTVPVVLRPGDTVRIGRTLLEVES